MHHPGGCYTPVVDEGSSQRTNYVKNFECLQKRYIKAMSYCYYYCLFSQSFGGVLACGSPERRALEGSQHRTVPDRTGSIIEP